MVQLAKTSDTQAVIREPSIFRTIQIDINNIFRSDII